MFNVFDFHRMFTEPKIEQVSFANKPLQESSLLVWDIENISIKYLPTIKKIADYTPEKLFVVTSLKLGNRKKMYLQQNYFDILDQHKGIADDKIKAVIKSFSLYRHLIIVSSDSDFVKTVEKFSKNGKVQWIIDDKNKKRIIMKMNLTNNNIKISTF